MQQSSRPYVTSGIALVSAGFIAVTPIAPPPSAQHAPAIQLADTDSPYADLFTHTVDNLENIANNADLDDITAAFNAFFTQPLDVLEYLTDLSPDVTTDLSGLPAQVTVELPPALALGIAAIGSFETAVGALHHVLGDFASGDSQGALSAFVDGTAEVLDAYLNGQQGIDLLGGIIDIPLFNGLLAPEQPVEVDLNLTKLLDALGLGNLDLSNLDLSGLLDQLGLGNLNLGDLFDDLGIAGDKLGDLLAGDSGTLTLGSLLDDLGLGALNLGDFSLSNILSDLGLDDVLNLNLTDILDGLGLNVDLSDLDLGDLLDNLGLGGLQLGDLLDSTGLLSGVLDTLNGVLGGIFSGLGSILDPILGALGLSDLDSLLSLGDLQSALNDVDLGQLLAGTLLGSGQADGTLSLTGLLDALGIDIPDTGDLTISDLLEDLLGAAGLPSTGDLTLGSLLDDLNIFNLDVTGLLNTVDLGGLLDMLGLSDLNLNLGDLVGDITSLDLDGLLNDLGLGEVDLATIDIDPFGGLVTELVDDLPGQIAEAFGGSAG
jgi:hypothetical protein